MMRITLIFPLLFLFVWDVTAGQFPDVRVEKINERIYAMLGPVDVPNKRNLGYMNNNLVVIGNNGVILVDAGSHRAVAKHIDQAIKTVTAKPITHILVTHHHADHHLGASYFDGAKIIATEYCAQQIKENGRGLVNFMSRNTGLNLRDNMPVVPQETLASRSRKAIEIDGIRLELISTNTAHTEGDMVVWLPDDGVLASGDILVNTINPNYRDGNLMKWLGVLNDDILKLPFRIAMPGHGPLMKREDVTDFRDLNAGFYKGVESVYKTGGAESDVRKKLDLSKWQSLGRFDDMMGNNINKVWLEVEEANF